MNLVNTANHPEWTQAESSVDTVQIKATLSDPRKISGALSAVTGVPIEV